MLAWTCKVTDVCSGPRGALSVPALTVKSGSRANWNVSTTTPSLVPKSVATSVTLKESRWPGSLNCASLAGENGTAASADGVAAGTGAGTACVGVTPDGRMGEPPHATVNAVKISARVRVPIDGAACAEHESGHRHRPIYLGKTREGRMKAPRPALRAQHRCVHLATSM